LCLYTSSGSKEKIAELLHKLERKRERERERERGDGVGGELRWVSSEIQRNQLWKLNRTLFFLFFFSPFPLLLFGLFVGFKLSTSLLESLLQLCWFSVVRFVCFVCVCECVEEKEGRKNNHKKKTPAFGDFVLGDFGVCVCVFCSSSFGFCGFCDK